MEIIIMPEAEGVLHDLSPERRLEVGAALNKLEQHGSALGTDLVKRIKSSRHPELHELRPAAEAGHVRLLFGFHGGGAVVLRGGDKTGEWRAFYLREVPAADHQLDVYKQHATGGRPWARVRAGMTSAGSSRSMRSSSISMNG